MRAPVEHDRLLPTPESADPTNGVTPVVPEPKEPIVERIGQHAGVRYGASYRVLPIAILSTPRGAHVIAEILWDSEHRASSLARSADDGGEARRRAVADLKKDIAQRLWKIVGQDGVMF